MKYRHELKFLVSDRELEILRYRLKALMEQDRHQKGDSYRIRSLYFDDFWDSYLQENEDGVDQRKKYRIRIYDGKDTTIKLEKKSKVRTMTAKEGTILTKEEALLYMKGQAPAIKDDDSSLKKEVFAQIKANGLRPVCIVEYERTAFVERIGNVRVTFDRNISGSNKAECFFEYAPMTPVLPAGQHILEVKYDELLPDYIAQVLEIGTLQRTSFSKYYYARKCEDI